MPSALVRKPRMRSACAGLRAAIPLCVLLFGCVEQDEDKPTAEDMAAAKQNILTTAPTPKYAVNADLDGKVIYLGLDVDHIPIEPGKDVTLTHYWKLVASTGPFLNTMTGGAVPQKTEAKLLWDKKFLYVGIENEDSDVWAKLDKRDDKLWTQEADEIMIDADGNGRTYIELQVAPNGNLFDTYLPERRKYEDTIDPKMKPFSWNSKTVAKVRVDGTLNKR